MNAFRITNAGNVGIGTVESLLRSFTIGYNSNNAQSSSTNYGAGESYFGSDAGIAELIFHQGELLVFYTGQAASPNQNRAAAIGLGGTGTYLIFQTTHQGIYPKIYN